MPAFVQASTARPVINSSFSAILVISHNTEKAAKIQDVRETVFTLTQAAIIYKIQYSLATYQRNRGQLKVKRVKGGRTL